MLLWAPLSIIVCVAMELWAGFLHGQLWHGALWPIHGSHHRPRAGHLEWNDLLSGLHAPLAIALILIGCVGPPGALREVCFGVGLGMSAFGLAYFVVHDGLVHGRLPLGFLRRFGYLRRVAEAHQAHHSGQNAAPYFFFLGPLELTRARGTAFGGITGRTEARASRQSHERSHCHQD